MLTELQNRHLSTIGEAAWFGRMLDAVTVLESESVSDTSPFLSCFLLSNAEPSGSESQVREDRMAA